MIIIHETPEYFYDREHVYILTEADYQSDMAELEEAAADSEDATVKVLKTPPTHVTRVTAQSGGKYMVELVYKCLLRTQRLEYQSCLVGSDGSIELQEKYVFVEGAPGMIL